MIIKRSLAEMFGTFTLVLLGCGSAIFAGPQIGNVGVALSFGFTLLLLVYSVGPISGCHVNPAVTLSMLLTRKIKFSDTICYIIAQLLGAILAGFTLYHVAQGSPSFNLSNGFALNGFGVHSPHHYSAMSCFIVETLITTLLLVVVLATTKPSFPQYVAGMAIGFTLCAIHLFSIPVTNTSVNIARSLGTAIVAQGWALEQLWLFATAQLAAVVIAVTIHKLSITSSK